MVVFEVYYGHSFFYGFHFMSFVKDMLKFSLGGRPVKGFCKINNFVQCNKDCAELLKSPSYDHVTGMDRNRISAKPINEEERDMFKSKRRR